MTPRRYADRGPSPTSLRLSSLLRLGSRGDRSLALPGASRWALAPGRLWGADLEAAAPPIAGRTIRKRSSAGNPLGQPIDPLSRRVSPPLSSVDGDGPLPARHRPRPVVCGGVRLAGPQIGNARGRRLPGGRAGGLPVHARVRRRPPPDRAAGRGRRGAAPVRGRHRGRPRPPPTRARRPAVGLARADRHHDRDRRGGALRARRGAARRRAGRRVGGDVELGRRRQHHALAAPDDGQADRGGPARLERAPGRDRRGPVDGDPRGLRLRRKAAPAGARAARRLRAPGARGGPGPAAHPSAPAIGARPVPHRLGRLGARARRGGRGVLRRARRPSPPSSPASRSAIAPRPPRRGAACCRSGTSSPCCSSWPSAR